MLMPRKMPHRTRPEGFVQQETKLNMKAKEFVADHPKSRSHRNWMSAAAS